MAEEKGMDFGVSLPQYDTLRDELRAYCDSNRENDQMPLDKFRTDLIQIVQRTVPELSLEDALMGLRESVAAGDAIGRSPETLKKDLAWGRSAI